MAMNQAMEENIFTIISCAGAARSLCFEALEHAKKGAFDKAEESLHKAQTELSKTHQTHTGMIQKEAAGGKHEFSLLLVHAEDHLMNTMFTKDMVKEMIEILRRLTQVTGGKEE